MNLLRTVAGEDLKKEAVLSPPEGPGFDISLVLRAEYMEVWGTSATDPGEDYTEFRLKASDGSLLEDKRISGF